MSDDFNGVLARAECLHTKADVDASMDHMAAKMKAVMADENPVFLCVVIGAIIPMGHLMTRIDFPCEVNYIHASRYQGAQRGAELKWAAKPTCDLKGRTVVVYDDILDRGLTMSALLDYCKAAGAKKVYSAVMVDKKVAREPGGLEAADFKGLDVGNDYVFGFGLDFHNNLRHVPGIYKIHEQDKA